MRQTSCLQEGRVTSNRPRLGLSFPARTFSAVDFPIPFVPTSPSTCPGLGDGNLRRTLIQMPELWQGARHHDRLHKLSTSSVPASALSALTVLSAHHWVNQSALGLPGYVCGCQPHQSLGHDKHESSAHLSVADGDCRLKTPRCDQCLPNVKDSQYFIRL